MESSASKIRSGDAILVSGQIGNHGVAVMSERNGITFDPPVVSDTAPLNSLIESMGKVTGEVRFMRDPRGEGLQQP